MSDFKQAQGKLLDLINSVCATIDSVDDESDLCKMLSRRTVVEAIEDAMFFETCGHYSVSQKLFNSLTSKEACSQIISATKRHISKRQVDGITQGSREERLRALLIYSIRETFRDGFDLQQTINRHSDAISELIDSNDLQFIEKLGLVAKDIRTKPGTQTRSTEGWIKRLWVTLSLWDTDRTEEVYDRLEVAASIFKGIVLDYKQIESALRQARNRKQADFL